MKRLRVGIAGYGVVGPRRRPFIDAHPRLETAAISDVRFERKGVFPDGVRFYSDYRELIAKEPLDLLFVSLPNYLAADATIRGLEKGLHVFCEKPPGRDIADVVRVRAVERRHPRQKLKYGFNHRYHDSVRDALKIVRSGRLGRVLNLNGVYGKSHIVAFENSWRADRKRSGGGILLDQGIHMLDLMRLFAGDFAEVRSVVSNSFWGHDVEDNAYALMKTKGGIVAMLHSSATLWRHRFHLDITLEKGALTLAGILSGSKSYGAETLTVSVASKRDSGDPKETTTRYNHDPSWRDEIWEFADCVLKKRKVGHGSSLDALKAMELIYRIYCADPGWKRAYRLSDRVPKAAR